MSDDRCYGNKTTSSGSQLYEVSSPYICPGTESVSGNSRCCGHTGVCLANGICQSLSPPPNGTGYYIGMCTDRNFEDRDVCHNACSSLKVQDIVYNKTSGVWHCCGLTSNGDLRCENPTKIVVKAPSPADLQSQYSASSSSFTATASSTLPAEPTSTGTLPSSTSSESSGSSGLSTGAQAGIGAGVGVVAIAAIAGIIFFLLRRRRKQRTPQAKPGVGPWGSPNGYQMMAPGQTPIDQTAYAKQFAPDPTNPAAYYATPPYATQSPVPVELSPQATRPVELMETTRKENSTAAELPP
ncbi:hypothetical protein PV05_03504 [Exophiala xenobiotica]|uniref:Mid2 domain-containing protein n=1 Tax=Exophiala xenobiotica TaxID=348802 RepID=A0A0D2EW82_9EURO|nr:uncharacterized protein PV05_03504 [Exophiala xenobiotica]KIW59020.1 hypothetical protein PV05_03504 [Exophiala xenobiotica]